MDDEYDDSKPLSNADFRRMLETPRHVAGKQQGGGEKKKRSKPGRNHKQKQVEGPAEEDDGYRDRAAERRKGIVTDFDAIPEDLANILQGGQANLNKLSYEESKFLGGDIAHTHLVKGLDFALLQKIRAEQEAEKKEGEDSDAEEGVQTLAQQQQQQHQEVKLVTPMGRAVHAFFFDPQHRRSRADVAQMFLPRRTAFVYELGEAHAPDAPTLLRRSKEDCPKVRETMLGAVDSTVLERMAKIMSYMSLAGGKKKIKKKDKLQLLQGMQAGLGARAAANGSSAAHTGPTPASLRKVAGAGAVREGAAAQPPLPVGAGEDEDIFADAGTDYVVERRQGQRAQGSSAAVPPPPSGSRYFSQLEDAADLPPLPAEGPAPPPPPPPAAGDDMELEELGPPPLPPSADDEAGPALPAAGADYSSAYPDADAVGAYPNTDAAYEAARALGVSETADRDLVDDRSRAAFELTRDSRVQKKQEASGLAVDAYAECYPSYYEYAGTVVDSDDEEGAAAAAKGVGLSRFDFQTEEEYHQYVAANPQRAAAAAGGKGGAQKGQKEASKRENKQQQKLSSQLGKIQKIMEEKGHGHANAFKEGGGRVVGSTNGEASMPAKKRRI